MPKTAVIQARIDPAIKEKAQQVLETLHISMSEAISLYLTQVALHRGIPFEICIPNKITLSAIQDAEERKNLRAADSVDELWGKLGK
jgi:DNA-damage-inducible protein J